MEEVTVLIPDVWDYVFQLRDRLSREEKERWLKEHDVNFTVVKKQLKWAVMKWRAVNNMAGIYNQLYLKNTSKAPAHERVFVAKWCWSRRQ